MSFPPSIPQGAFDPEAADRLAEGDEGPERVDPDPDPPAEGAADGCWPQIVEEFLALHPTLLVHSVPREQVRRAFVPPRGDPCKWKGAIFRITIQQSTDEVLEICNAWDPGASASRKTAKFF